MQDDLIEQQKLPEERVRRHFSKTQQVAYRLYRLFIMLLAGLIMSVAVVVGFLGLAMPWLNTHPERVQELLSSQLGRPVHFTSMHGVWHATGPKFTLKQLVVTDPATGKDMLLGETELAIYVYAMFYKDLNFVELNIIGMSVEAIRDKAGEWQIIGIPRDLGAKQGQKTSILSSFYDLGAVNLRAATVHILDEQKQLDFSMQRIDLRFASYASRRHLGGKIWVDKQTAPLQFACAFHVQDQRCYFSTDNLAVAQLPLQLFSVPIQIVSGDGALQLWATREKSQWRFDVKLQTQDLVLRGLQPIIFSDGDLIEPRTHLIDQVIEAHWRQSGEAWDLIIDQFASAFAIAPTMQLRLRHGTDPDAAYLLECQQLRLQDWAALLSMSQQFPEALRRFLYESSPAAYIERAAFQISQNKQVQGYAQIADLRWYAGTRSPGLQSFSGQLVADGNTILFEPRGVQTVTLTWPHVFRQPLRAVLSRGVVGLWQEMSVWHAALSDFTLAGDGFSAQGQMHFIFNGEQPWLDASIQLGAGRITQAKLFWPINKMSDRLVQWLDHALQDGQIVGGGVVIHGDLDHWPFREQEGRFTAHVDIKDTHLKYQAGWPDAHLNAARILFINGSMQLVDGVAEILDNPLSNISAEIENFKMPILTVHAQTTTEGNAVLRFLRQSPLQRKLGAYLFGLSIDGHTNLDFDMRIPLKKELGDLTLSGTGVINDATVVDTKWRLHFTKANGAIHFTEHGIAADDLQAKLDENSVSLMLRVGNLVKDSQYFVEAGMNGKLPVHALLNLAGEDMRYYGQWFTGKSDWQVGLRVPKATTQETMLPYMHLSSDMQGTSLLLPAPLNKDLASKMPISVMFSLPVSQKPVYLRCGKLLQLYAQMPDDTHDFAAEIALGTAELKSLTTESGVRITGDMTALDLSGWVNARERLFPESGQKSSALDVDVHASEMAMLSRAFNDTHFELHKQQDGLRLAFLGPQIDGQMFIPDDVNVSKGIQADFQKLYFLEKIPGQSSEVFDPGSLPALHLGVKDFRLGDAQLGTVRVETFPAEQGMQIDSLEAKSKNLRLRATGAWTLIKGVEISQFDVSFTADDLGLMLSDLGYAGIVEHGQTTAQLRGQWLGSPAQFALSRVAGTLSAKVGAGRVLDVEPGGAGRLFGLMSLQALPRRLALDFRDLFSKGLPFDSITADFDLRQGDAYTRNLELNSVSADIRVTGRAGLIAKDYDQVLEVTPKVSSVLPVLGALTGGPIGAAAGLFAQGVLKNPLGQLTHARYKVDGSWDNPTITLVSKETTSTKP